MRRREFIGACSGVVLTTMSGCTGGGDDPDGSAVKNETGSGPSPSDGETTSEIIAEIKESGPSSELLDMSVEEDHVVYNDEFTVSATFANVGSEPIGKHDLAGHPEIKVHYTESDQSFREDFQRGAGILELSSGETTTITFGPFDAAITGEWTIEAGEYIEYIRKDAETTLDVQPRSVSVGDPVELLYAVSMVVEDFHLYEAFFTDYIPWGTSNLEPVVGLETPPEGQLFVVVELTLLNEAYHALRVDSTIPQEYELALPQFTIEPLGSHEFSEQVTESHARLPGERFEEVSVPSDETETAWILGTIDKRHRDHLSLEFDKWRNTGPPEVVIEIADTSYPSFELVEFITPDRWHEGRQRFGAIVENVGTGSGTFRGIVQYQGFETDEFVDPRPGNELEAELEPGETVEVTTQYDHEEGVRYRLKPFGETVRL